MMLTPFQQHESQRNNKARNNTIFSPVNTCPRHVETDLPDNKIVVSRQISPPDRQQERWCEYVKQLKYTCSLKETTDSSLKVPTPAKPVQNKQTKANTALDKQPHTRTEAPSPTKCKRVFVPPLYIMSGPRVRFQDNDDDDGCSVSTCSLTKGSSSKVSTVSGLTDTSHQHQCLVLDKKRAKKLFFTRKETKKIILAACDSAQWFRLTHPGAVSQVEKLFQDICSIDPEECGHDDEGQDEEEVELLRNFLQDWAESDGRGLEEKMLGVLRSERHMTIQSILAYQEKLREQYHHSGHLCYFDDDHYSDSISDLLRARSESASRKARMFAMYLALGDALVAASSSSGEPYFF